MCDTCGCNITTGNSHLLEGEGRLAHTASGAESVEVLRGLMTANDHAAAHNRGHFDAAGVLVINLMSSPGAGKTALIEATADALRGRVRLAVVEGDLETENDAERVRAKGIPAVQITTGTACHLDAHLVHHALHELPLEGVDILFIENVGNLVCPASFDLGQHRNVILLSVPEGDDKPAKYPVMFRAADLVLLSKADLLGVLDDFDPKRAETAVRNLASRAPVVPVATRRTPELTAWLEWLERERVAHRAAPRRSQDHGHAQPGHSHP
ncbi:MAG: hydrogenase nickel incorporation protein HypB [Chromatiales bacterium]|nr:hydrogenase nickel incorporation protein HypB [Chromatiales bacterium]